MPNFYNAELRPHSNGQPQAGGPAVRVPFQDDGSMWPYLREEVRTEHDFTFVYYEQRGEHTEDEAVLYTIAGRGGDDQPNLKPVHTITR